jgi:DNA-binding Lrp family transcriptional regulator
MTYPSEAGSKGSAETSGDAAASIDCGRLQRMTLRAIREAKRAGRTSEEAAQRLDLPRVTVQPRTSELKAMGLIRDSGMRRTNASSGKRAVVWIAKEYMA